MSVGFDIRQSRDADGSDPRDLVARIAADPERWRWLVRHNMGPRDFGQLWRDAQVDVWVISWGRGMDTGFHDHDVSSGAVTVVEGEPIEERLMPGGVPRRLRRGAGRVFDFDAAHVHRMRQDSVRRAVSIHAYSPALWRTGGYVTDRDGALRRQSISYAEELRFVEAAS